MPNPTLVLSLVRSHAPSTIRRAAVIAGMSPDQIIVGIDVGLTYTGVAFCATDWSTPGMINRWPGINEIRNKVPTVVGYRAGTKSFTSWGFGCPPPGKLDRGEAVKDCFKLFLDPEFLEKTFKGSASRPVGRYGDVRYDDVRDWYKDFLTGLYKHIGEYISSFFELADWGKQTVDFLFSVPTTWEGSVSNEFKKIVKEAGFGKDGQGHSVNIQLTEAEAAAVYTAASPHHHKPLSVWSGDSQSANESTVKGSEMREGDIILVCDSGGGTTDVSVVKVISHKYIDEHDQEETEKITELEQLDRAIGDAIGSVQIDETFRERVDERLKDIRHKFPSVQLPEYAADDMVKEFQYIKEGVEENPPLPKILLRVPGLPRNFAFPEGMIESGHMVFTQNDIREIFNVQISGIFDLIDRQLIRINGLRSEKVSHFVLSGGLCSSKYVQSQLSRRYGLFGQGVKILIDENPQLVVCKGLVIDRLHQLKYNTFILPSLRCRSSYGILYNEPSDNKKTYDKKTRIRKDPNDGKKYAIGQIHWFLRQGELISRDKPISYDFFRFIDVGSPEMVWKDTIARSDSQAERLPSSIYEGDATAVCDIESMLSVDTLEKMHGAKRKQKRLFGIKIGKDFWKVSHKVLVHVSSANIRFEVQLNGDVIGSRTVPVKWAIGPGEVKQHNADNTVGEEDGDWRHCLIPE